MNFESAKHNGVQDQHRARYSGGKMPNTTNPVLNQRYLFISKIFCNIYNPSLTKLSSLHRECYYNILELQSFVTGVAWCYLCIIRINLRLL